MLDSNQLVGVYVLEQCLLQALLIYAARSNTHGDLAFLIAREKIAAQQVEANKALIGYEASGKQRHIMVDNNEVL